MPVSGQDKIRCIEALICYLGNQKLELSLTFGGKYGYRRPLEATVHQGLPEPHGEVARVVGSYLVKGPREYLHSSLKSPLIIQVPEVCSFDSKQHVKTKVHCQ